MLSISSRIPRMALHHWRLPVHRYKSSSPFSILGLTESTRPKYSDVKAAFVTLALEHHPDRTGGNADDFLKVRRAFESIRELPDGSCAVSEDDDLEWSDDSLSGWFFQETGQGLSFHMDSSTRKEVTEVVANMSQSGLDKGGMWDMARMIAREEELSPSKEEPKQLGDTTNRRRKR